MTADRHAVAFTLNGTPFERTVDGRLLGAFNVHDLLRAGVM